MSHYIIIVDNDPSHKTILNNNEISSSNQQKSRGILSDRKLNFDSHIPYLCIKAGQKFSARAHLSGCLVFDI